MGLAVLRSVLRTILSNTTRDLVKCILLIGRASLCPNLMRNCQGGEIVGLKLFCV